MSSRDLTSFSLNEKFLEITYSLTLATGDSCEQSHLRKGISKSWAIVEQMALTGLLGPVLSKVKTLGPRNRTL